MSYIEDLEKYLRIERTEEISKAVVEHIYEDIAINDPVNQAGIGGFGIGAMWADKHPSISTVLKLFKLFDEYDLIKDDLSFDPEHFIRTVIIPNFEEVTDNKK